VDIYKAGCHQYGIGTDRRWQKSKEGVLKDTGVLTAIKKEERASPKRSLSANNASKRLVGIPSISF